jgi:hypothetical protein
MGVCEGCWIGVPGFSAGSFRVAEFQEDACHARLPKYMYEKKTRQRTRRERRVCAHFSCGVVAVGSVRLSVTGPRIGAMALLEKDSTWSLVSSMHATCTSIRVVGTLIDM